MLTRLFAFDGQLLNLVSDNQGLTVVKHSCKLSDFPAAAPVAEELGKSPSGLQLDYVAFCNSFVQFEAHEAFRIFSDRLFHEFSSPVLRLHTAERQITSPPPKASV